MHYAHARASVRHRHGNKQCWFNIVCRMHFLGHVISPQGSARGCHESPWLVTLPPTPPPSVDNHQLASRSSSRSDYTHDSGWRLAVRMQSRIQFASFVFLFLGLLRCCIVPWNFVRMIESIFWNANKCSMHKPEKKKLLIISCSFQTKNAKFAVVQYGFKGRMP